MTPLCAADEAQLLTAVERANDFVESGCHPTQAVAKAAALGRLDPDAIRLVAQAYNTGRQLHHWEKSPTAIEKFASYPTADADAAIREAYAADAPQEKAAAVYGQPPDWLLQQQSLDRLAAAPTFTKAAQAVAPQAPDILDVQFAKRAAFEAASLRATTYERALLVKLAALRDYFRRSVPGRCSAGDFLEAARAYGFAADDVAIKVATEKLPAYELRTSGQGDWRAPLAILRDCHELGRGLAEARVKLAELTPPLPPKPKKPSPPTQKSLIPSNPMTRHKAAAGLMGLPGAEMAMGAIAGQAIRPLAGEDPDRQGLVDKLNDPKLDAELRRIQTQATLTGLMTDPDDPLHGYDPQHVAAAFNELSSLAPRTATQPAAIGPALRRQLAGRFEPHETAQLLKIDQALGRSPSRMGGGGEDHGEGG